MFLGILKQICKETGVPYQEECAKVVERMKLSNPATDVLARLELRFLGSGRLSWRRKLKSYFIVSNSKPME